MKTPSHRSLLTIYSHCVINLFVKLSVVQSYWQTNKGVVQWRCLQNVYMGMGYQLVLTIAIIYHIGVIITSIFKVGYKIL